MQEIFLIALVIFAILLFSRARIFVYRVDDRPGHFRNRARQNRKEGEVVIEKTGKQQAGKENEGEYIDYEEIKNNP